MGSIKAISLQLGVVQDIEKEYNAAGKEQLKGEGTRNNTVSNLSKSQDNYRAAVKGFQESMRLVNYVIKQQSDLGLEIPAKVLSMQKQNTSSIAYCEKRISDIDKAIASLK